MAGRNRTAFTLVELLVVIVIISMLVGLLLPAVMGGRERARQAQCTNNQHEIALAIHQYEAATHHFPGYLNKLGTSQIMPGDTRPPLSWITVLLPHLGREDAWREWRAAPTTTLPAPVRLPQAVCPSDSAKATGPALSYAANCGIQDGTLNTSPLLPTPRPENAADGVFHNMYNFTAPVVSSTTIKDGAPQTLLFSENNQAGVWYARLIDPSTNNPETIFEPDLGLVWFPSTYTPPTGEQVRNINVGKDDPCVAWPINYHYARPSSNHPGGVVVTFCDGHQQFVSENISPDTYRHLMTPDSRAAGLGPYVSDPELEK